MAFELDNVVAVVTGARGGIGREVVRAMKAAGATVIATDVAAPDDGVADHALAHDVTSQADWQAVADLAAETYGRIDALVNVAGISVVASIEETPLEEWRRINAVNVESVVIGVQTLLPLLKAGGKARASGASIVNFSSVGGIKGAPFNGAYCTSKAAVKMLSKCMGAEFAALGYNIRANSVHPGGIDTPMLQSIMQRYVDLGAVPSLEVSMQGVVAAHPIGRLGRPAEMAGGVVYLCSDAASFVTCSEFMMDGGYCMS
ncbi:MULTISPECIES: SDR family oxidoreductase [unclassified Novosphingobium]|uniref:SDR family oxidoreductase n=1 Tax=unclassified Novosphingobium TaxID=2644732 RepID=UPI001494E0D4|nr:MULTISPECIES: SDR family oxidoreductase [unclassified Novosphingobium]MBB3358064.1 NAD(P)-dependent dehydrogenase (short-subunit alcohol dehydrogenase family) [Novosphingobium sp. BK256]MBB3374425.1 NAD(P)-dependent dehydrogenase (short-subunit alcohol dehydrogenase family) [Novosphingobium sp. BK280]MBB3378837.1 NAD(P)-dependent dehydrogenase (short-subunit alcohol dehydrogenase family) [Novosphingobium sp. BK258]MBB3420531.1 NAD(P)-dependent dehydrogenase (short-subunit alcohol dehydrogena